MAKKTKEKTVSYLSSGLEPQNVSTIPTKTIAYIDMGIESCDDRRITVVTSSPA